MPSKYPVLKPAEVLKKLKKVGFEQVSQKGSHIKLSNGTRSCIVPDHEEIRKGTLKSILFQAGIELDDFLKL